VSDDEFVYVPEISTEGMERVCIWKTPGGHGFTAPNPRTVPRIRASVLRDLRQKIRQLDGKTGDP
jgi:hypothetical protein